MVREPSELLGVQKSVSLKLSEPVVDSDNPWADDLLARQDIANRLTNLVAAQELPLTVSLHGQWGTGKTFMLKRWQKDLEGRGFKAIYFNAWEDDFCDDPLLAIIGQLSSYFSDGRFKESVERVTSSAVPLIRSNFSSILTHFTGLTTDYKHDSPTKSDLVEQYLGQRHSKDMLKNELEKLSSKVYTESSHPLIFVVDELDRCRPTFAIELLERVKHIFDVPTTVFVFGLNRDELTKSLSSVYGDINADVYLRRFFDFEFNLPEVGSQRFAEHLIDRFNLGQVFQGLSNVTRRPEPIHDYENYRAVVPRLWSGLGLSLRDIDYGIRLIALLARNVPLHSSTHPFLLAALIAVKFKKPDLYHALVTGTFRTSEVMNYIASSVREDLSDRTLSINLDRIEGFLYCADSTNSERQERGESALAELEQVSKDSSRTSFSVISRRAQVPDQGQLQRIKRSVIDGRDLYIDGKVLGNLSALIDTYQTELRR